MSCNRPSPYVKMLQCRTPGARTIVQGEDGVRGTVSFYQTRLGTLVMAEIMHLPDSDTDIFAFHIHGGGDCTDPGTHYDPQDRPHPQHAGDMPPLFSNHGYAWTAFLTERFTVDEILGRTVIIHSGPDDFTTQPSGNPGARIACGVIQKV